MENKKNNPLLIILLVIFILSTILLGGYIVYDKSTNKINNDNNKTTNNNSDINDDKSENTEQNNIFLYIQSEILDLLSENSTLVFLNFSIKENLLKENFEKNRSYLIRSLQESKYNQQAPEGYMNHFQVALSDIKKYLKENFNYDYSENEIKEYFKDFLDEKKNVFIMPSYGHQGYTTIEKMYENNGYYYINICDSSDTTKKGTIVLAQENNKFYFYSSTGLN